MGLQSLWDALKMESKAGSEVDYLFLEIIPSNRRRILAVSVYRSHRDELIDLFISILQNLSVESNEIIILDNFNNNLLRSNTLIDPMRSSRHSYTDALSWIYQQLDRSCICKHFVKSYAIWPDFGISFLGPWSVIYNLWSSRQYTAGVRWRQRF